MGILKHFDVWRGVKLLDQEAEAGEREQENDLAHLTSSECIFLRRDLLLPSNEKSGAAI